MPRDPTDPGRNPGPGGYQGQDKTPPTISPGPPVQTFKQQVFTITCRGMKPNTIHKFYYEGVERGNDCLPVRPKATTGQTGLGSPLKTNDEGEIEFKFYFTLDVERQVDASNKVKFEPAGDKKFELRATDSSAAKIVPMKVHYVTPPSPPPPPSPSRPPSRDSRGSP